MAKFEVVAEVNQLVTKKVRLLVKARNKEAAALKTHEALQEYPDPVTVRGVERIQTVDIQHWVPRDIEVKKVSEEKDIA